jgi:hypothetical protein
MNEPKTNENTETITGTSIVKEAWSKLDEQSLLDIKSKMKGERNKLRISYFIMKKFNSN